ncbi:TPA: hypothetical protein ACG0BA_000157 [Serratia odorifera]
MSWFPLPHGKALPVAVCLGLFAWLAVSNWGYRKELQLTQQQLSTWQLENSKQAVLIATLQAQDAQNRALVAAQQKKEQQLRHQADINQRKLRDALKNDECANRAMPNAALKLLLPDTKSGSVSGGAVTP